MKLPWKVTKKADTPADIKIEEIKNLLFPSLELREDYNEQGLSIKYHIDYSVDSNLDAVLIDLQEGQNDEAVRKTLNAIIKRLDKARRLLEAYAQIDKDAKYIIVDTGEENIEVMAKERDD